MYSEWNRIKGIRCRTDKDFFGCNGNEELL
jgi:hypothetical protein